ETNITVNGSANITATKTANVSSVVIGDSVSYNITIANNGDVSGDFNVTDYWYGQDLVFEDYSVVFEGNASNVAFDNVTKTWTIWDLNANSTIIIVVNFTTNATGIVTNYINVTSFGDDNVTENETNIVVNRVVNISIVKTANVSNGVLGDHVVYTITVTNNGNHSEDFSVIDYYNSYDLVYINGSFVINSGNGSKVKYLGDFVWNITDLHAGESASWNVTFIANATGIITNHIKVINENGTVNYNNASIEVNGSVNITAIKKANVTSAVLGDVVSYNITIINNGDVSGDFNVTDYWNNRDLIIGNYLVIIDGNATNISYNGDGSWTVWDLKANSSVVIIVNFTVNATGVVANYVNVSGIGNDTNITNETNVTVNGSVNITAIKKANVTSAVLGDVVSYNITIINNGDVSGDFNVTDYFNSSDLVYNDYNVIYSGNATGVYFNGNTDTWTVWDLKANSSIVIVVNFTTNATGIITNRINVTSYGNDTNTTNETNITVTPNKKVNITVDVPENTTVGDNVTVNITVTDKDGNPIANITVDVVIDGKFIGNFTTDEDGRIYVNVTVTDPIEDVNVTFGGNDEYAPGNASSVIVSDLLDTEIVIDVPANSYVGDDVVVNVTLVDEFGNPIVGESVEIIIDGVSIGHFITDEKGMIHIPVHVVNTKTSINAVFNGSERYYPTVGHGVMKSHIHSNKTNRSASHIIVNDFSSDIGKKVKLTAKVTDDYGNPISGVRVKFYVNGKYVGSALTDIDGIATLPYIPKHAGIFHVLGVFEGNNQYNASEDIGILNVVDNGSDNGGNDTNGSGGDNGGASMKTTGVPLIAILIIFLFLIAIIARRKKKKRKDITE
ncbi:MAG: DUF11 domain-containing protein, partial [Methanobrevibacter sp.]|nr:DUF11 domain-containing protein [Candidatus Methanoflexus mossambicus]